MRDKATNGLKRNLPGTEMRTKLSDENYKERLINLFEDNKEQLLRDDTRNMAAFRYKALEKLRELDFPTRKHEDWRHTDLSGVMSLSYHHSLDPVEVPKNIGEIFACDVHNFETNQIPMLNGWYVSEENAPKSYPDGVITCSLALAKKEFSGILDHHYGRYADPGKNIFQAMNAAFAQDGVFIYVPDGVQVEIPLQIISIVNHPENLLLFTRNLIIIGKNSSLVLVQCDDSTNLQASFNNSVTEIYIDKNARLDHYKLQNLNNNSTLLNSSYFHLEESSSLRTNAISLNGGLIRNYSHVRLNESHAEADIFGVYLMDKQQHVDNQVYVNHASPDCRSNELFKGILDDEATAVFNGHIYVARDAQRTNAFQQSRNILLTNKASAKAKPFLEIYADDVKCSHGATIGQLDNEALFYLRSRGICLASARLLMMYAFAAEVVQKISIPALQNRIDEMVKRRLRGELSICEKCVLHCENHDKEIIFDIDLTKI